MTRNKEYYYYLKPKSEPVWLTDDEVAKKDTSVCSPVMCRFQKEKVLIFNSFAFQDTKQHEYNPLDMPIDEIKKIIRRRSSSSGTIHNARVLLEHKKKDFRIIRIDTNSVSYDEVENIKDVEEWIDKKLLEGI